MVSQDGLRLATTLITTHFGDLVAKVCECLLRRGSLSLPDVIRFTELSSSQVKNSLLVLIQHNCVQAFSTPRPAAVGTEIRTMTMYMALFDNIIHRLRFPKFLAIVKDDLGPQCKCLLEGLLQNGRLTLEQLADRAGQRSGKQPEASSSASKLDALRAEFDRLVHAHYVERCPRPEPFVTPPVDQTASKRRRSKSDERELSLEELATSHAALPDSERFSEIVGMSTDGPLESESIGDYSDTSGSKKRKFGGLEIDDEIQAAVTEIGVLWRANFEKFVYCLKKKACVANVRSRLGLDAGVILEAMIESNSKEKDKNSVSSSIDNIIEAVRGKPGGIAMTLEHVRALLEKLGAQLCSEEAGIVYSTDLKDIVEICKNSEVEALVLKKYGEVASRIFRFLTQKGGPQETDRISEITLIEKKAAHAILHKLWKDEYLEMKKVAGLGTGQTQYFMWSANKNELLKHILNDAYHAVFNLYQKASAISKQAQTCQDKVKKPKLHRAWLLLEASLLKLDDALMLLQNF